MPDVPQPTLPDPTGADLWRLVAAVQRLLADADDPSARLPGVPAVLAAHLGATDAALLLLDEEGEEPQVFAHPAPSAAVCGDAGVLPLERCLAERRALSAPGGALAVPLVHGEQVLGALGVRLAASGQPGAAQAEAVLDVVATLVGAALAGARQRRLGRMAAEWAILQRIDATIRQARTLEEAMAGTLRDLSTVLLSSEAVLAALNTTGEILHTATLNPIPPGGWTQYRRLVLHCAGALPAPDRPLLLGDLAATGEELTLATREGAAHLVRAVAAVPLRLDSIERQGLIILTSAEADAFSPVEVTVLRRIALQVAASLDHIIMSEQKRLFLDVQESLATISRALVAVETGQPIASALRSIVEAMVNETAQIHGAALHLSLDGELPLVAACGAWPREQDDGDWQRWQAAARQAWSSGQPVQLGSMHSQRGPGADRPWSLFVMPLSTGEESFAAPRPLGVLSLMTARFDFYVAGFASVWLPLAQVVGRTIRNMRLLTDLQQAKTALEARQEAILRSRNTLEALFESFPYAIFIVDRSMRVIMQNGAGAPDEDADEETDGDGEALAPRPSPAWLGRPCYEVLPCHGPSCAGCRIGESLQAGRVTKRTVQEGRAPGAGGPRYLEIVTYPIRGEMGAEPQAAVVAVQDVTGERQLTESLIRVEKFTAIGRFAASIAHEINNPLSIVMLNAEMLLADLDRESPLRESAELIFRGAQRAAQAVRNLQSYSRDEALSFTATPLARTVDPALALVAPQLSKHGARVSVEIPADLPLLRASPKHLEHVWATLALDSLDAMVAGGVAGRIRLEAGVEDGMVAVTVSREGPQIPEARLSEIFSPFGFAALQGAGSGLGLYGCQQIVKQHGGAIEAHNLEGGFCFVVRLPMATPED